MIMVAIYITRQLIARRGPPCLCRFFSSSSTVRADDSPYPPAVPVSALEPRNPPSQPRFTFVKSDSSPRAPPTQLANELINSISTNAHRQAQRRKKTAEHLTRMEKIRDLERLNRRRWRPGDIYAPHDLSPEEMQKWDLKRQGERDVFDVLGINPLEEYKNVSILGSFVTPLGRIMHRRETGLRAVNQRKIAKAIRRAIAMGLMPSVHKHPEILENEAQKINERRYGEDGRRGILRQF